MNFAAVTKSLLRKGWSQSEIAALVGSTTSGIGRIAAGSIRYPRWDVGDSLIRLNAAPSPAPRRHNEPRIKLPKPVRVR
jgi:transcriptional regulator with XRE-family HTH domain